MSFSRHGILATVCLLALCLYGAEWLEAACVSQLGGFYQFWPADGNAYDVHGTDHGVLKNGATYAAGKVGLAFSFDGVDDYVEIPDNNIYVAGGNFFTIEFWVKFNSVRAGTFTAPGTIFVGNDEGQGNRDKWYFAHTGSFLFFHINNPADLQQFIAHAAFNPVTNQWYHLAVVRTSGSTYKIYINGVEAISEVNTNPIPNTIAPLTLGQAENTGFLNGQLDEVTIYNYDLTPAELLAIVNAGTDGKCRVCTTTPSDLTDWWPGNGNALDVQGTNSGTLIGGATFGNSGWVGEAFSFNGVDGAVTTTRDLPYNSFSNMTWECWVYPARTNYGRQQIMSIDDGGFDFSLLIEGNSFAVFTGNQSWIPPNQLVYPFEWQHVAVVYSPTNVEFYRNGVRYSLGSGAVYGGSNSRFNIGRNPAFGEYFQGMIDDVAIYNRALTETEIQQIYASANSGKCRVTTAGPRIEVSPITLGFGPTTIGQTNANERTFVVQNTGSTTLSNSLAISNAVFSLASPGASFPVAPGSNQVVKVWFIPTAATNYSGTLTITHNDPIRSSIVVDLSGTGEPPGVCTNPPSGLVSWWRAENYSAADAWGTNDGVLTNGTTYAAGKVGTGFHFTNPTNYVDAPMGAMAVGDGNFTVEGWIKAEPGNNTYTIISFGGVYYPTIYLGDTEGRLYMWSSGGFAPIGTGFKDGQFHHFAVVRQGNAADALKYYKDSVLLGLASPPYPLGASRCYLGWDGYPGDAFQGVIDELSFYNRALDPSEIAAIFNAGSAGKCGTGGTTNAPGCPTVSSINPTSGAVGTNVTITGTNFTGVTAVKFPNNVAATFTNINDTTIIATVPTNAVTGVITISKTNCLGAPTGTFTIGTGGTPGLGFGRVGALTANSGEDSFLSAVIDPGAGFAYFGANTSPGIVVKVRLSDFTRVGALTLNSGENLPDAAVIDTAGGFAYFVTDTNPGIVVKVRLSDFTRVAALTLNPGESRFYLSAVIDPGAGFAYFGTATSPGIVVKVRLSDFTRVGALTLNSGESYLSGAVIDPTAGFAYFGTFTSPSMVVKVRLSDFTRVGALTLNSGEDRPGGSVIDPAAGFAYFGRELNPGKVVKVRLSDFTRVGALTLNSGEGLLDSAVIDPGAGFAYFGTFTSPAKVVKVQLSDLTRVGAVTLNSGENLPDCAVIDPGASFAYFGTQTFPGKVVKIDLAVPVCPTITSINPTSGAVGTNVTITGANFTGVTAVKFANNVTAQFSVSNDTTIIATVPTNAVTGSISIIKTNCAPNAQTGTFTISTDGIYQPGDVFVSGIKYIKRFCADGTLLQTITNNAAEYNGMAFDTNGNLYAADFVSHQIHKFDTKGNFLGVFATLPGSPEGIIFDSAQNLFVGTVSPVYADNVLKKFNLSGTLLDTFTPAREDRGIDWIDLAPDQHTLFYTSEGSSVKRYDLATRSQLPDFANSLPSDAFQMKLLADGGLLLADGSLIRRFNAAGVTVQTYDEPQPDPLSTKQLFTVALDVDGTTFWAVDDNAYGSRTNTVFRFDLASGALISAWYLYGANGIAVVRGDRPNTGCVTTNVTPNCPAVTSLTPTSGAVGSSVMITGTNFTGVTAVTFSNNVPATTFTVVNDTTITTTVPTNAVTGAITISKTNCTDAQTSTFTIGTGGLPGLKADYQFQGPNPRRSSVGTPPDLADLTLVPGGPIPNSLITDTVDCASSRSVLSFPKGNGLVLATSGVIPSNTYSIVILFKFTEQDTKRAIVDFKNGMDGRGVYAYPDNNLNFLNSWNNGPGISSGSGNQFTANTYVQVVLTRTGNDGNYGRAGVDTGYVNGVPQFTNITQNADGIIDPGNLRFFVNQTNSGEFSAGAVARIRLYDHALSTAEVAALDRLPNGACSTTCLTITSLNPTSGAVGSSVTIGGTNFTGVTAVKFANNVAAIFTVVNDTTITAMVPTGAVTGAIMIGKTNCPDAQSGTFTVGTTNVNPQSSKLVAWGENVSGQLGYDGGSTTLPISVNTTGALAGKIVTAVAAGNYHSIALTSDGKVFGWGLNYAGQVGDGTHTNRFAPVPVFDGALAGRTITAIASGWYHNLALASDGTAYAWGDNSNGALGDGTGASSATPVAINTSGALAGKTVIAIAAGGWHSLALTSDRRIYAWGTYGIGSGTTDSTGVPVAVDMTGALNGKTIVAIAAGFEHSLALTSEGKVYSWGYNSFGQLGITNWASFVPAPVLSGAFSGKFITAIAAGQAFSLAQASDGTVFSWGANGSGQLGNGDSSDAGVPVAVNMSGALNGKQVLNLKAGNAHALMIASDGKLYSWGINSSGELGIGPAPDSNVPVAVNTNGVLAGKTLSAIAAGYSHNLAIIGSPPAPPPILAGLAAQFNGSTLTLSWSAALNMRLETASSLTPPVTWVPATNTPVLVGDQQVVTLAPTGTLRFFRLAVTP